MSDLIMPIKSTQMKVTPELIVKALRKVFERLDTLDKDYPISVIVDKEDPDYGTIYIGEDVSVLCLNLGPGIENAKVGSPEPLANEKLFFEVTVWKPVEDELDQVEVGNCHKFGSMRAMMEFAIPLVVSVELSRYLKTDGK